MRIVLKSWELFAFSVDENEERVEIEVNSEAILICWCRGRESNPHALSGPGF